MHFMNCICKKEMLKKHIIIAIQNTVQCTHGVCNVHITLYTQLEKLTNLNHQKTTTKRHTEIISLFMMFLYLLLTSFFKWFIYIIS